ncbi:MAG: hypothetical protein REI09_05340 [Candidatus Dactylopiibacterium sp.]|nr:hypothetical protein [Candidatus Dactylopiibacterium sp.]
MTAHTPPPDPRALLLAGCVQRVLDAVSAGRLTLDAPDDEKSCMAALFDELEARHASFLNAEAEPETRAVVRRVQAGERLARRLLDPDDLGFTANREIRDAARIALGIEPVESIHPKLVHGAAS